MTVKSKQLLTYLLDSSFTLLNQSTLLLRFCGCWLFCLSFYLYNFLYHLGLISVSEDGRSIQVADARKEWKTLLTHYGPVLGVILGALVFIIVMPIAGLLFCCCRCAGKCGSRSQPFEKRYDPCRRHSYGILLAGITVLIS